MVSFSGIPEYLAIRPGTSYGEAAHRLGISASTAHQSVKRLTYAGLVRPAPGAIAAVNLAALIEFLRHGVRYAFPARRGRPRRGVPTAHSAPMLQDEMDPGAEPVVWPTPRGKTVGSAIDPLIKSGPELPERCADLYHLLTLADALRIGTARDREVAGRRLTERLEATAAAALARAESEESHG